MILYKVRVVARIIYSIDFLQNTKNKEDTGSDKVESSQ